MRFHKTLSIINKAFILALASLIESDSPYQVRNTFDIAIDCPCCSVDFAETEGNIQLEITDSKVRTNSPRIASDSHQVKQITLSEIVGIKLSDSPVKSIEYKALKSFHDSIDGCFNLTDEDCLRVWIATMYERNLSESSRRRYFGKLAASCSDLVSDSKVFDRVRGLIEISFAKTVSDAFSNCKILNKSIDWIIKESDNKPTLQLFLYLLLNGSSDIENAINLQTDDYNPGIEQLGHVIKIEKFHHRRKYIFDLKQSQKRLPQLIHEISAALEIILRQKGMEIRNGFDRHMPTALWIAKARSIGVTMPEIRAIINDTPPEFGFLNMVNPASLTPFQINLMLKKVANSFCISDRRWYAIKLRRGTSYSQALNTICEAIHNATQDFEPFYPTRERVILEGKKKIKTIEPFIPDIVFIYTLPVNATEIDKALHRNNNGWVIRLINKPDSEYAIIDSKSMMTFQKAVGQFSADMKIKMTNRPPMEIGRSVRITGGPLEGFEGTIFDIKADNRHTHSEGRLFCIRISDSQFIRWEADIDEMFIEPLP